MSDEISRIDDDAVAPLHHHFDMPSVNAFLESDAYQQKASAEERALLEAAVKSEAEAEIKAFILSRYPEGYLDNCAIVPSVDSIMDAIEDTETAAQLLTNGELSHLAGSEFVAADYALGRLLLDLHGDALTVALDYRRSRPGVQLSDWLTVPIPVAA